MDVTQYDVVIIDTECANLNSVKYAFERLNAKVLITDNPQHIQQAKRVLLPGVGSAQAAMQNLERKQLISVIQNLTQPVLGICLGMQLLTERSFEQGKHTQCLGLIPTEINRLDAANLPMPHMGWNQLNLPAQQENRARHTHPLFEGLFEKQSAITTNNYVYFVHSYCAPVSEFTIATSHYGQEFSAGIAKDNFIGLQFHPEKSASVGAKILQNFITYY